MYIIGVSNAAKKTLNKKPLIKSTEKRSHSITLKVHNKKRTEKVSMN